MMKKILLAGGAGYIGTELCKRLLRLDYKVTVIDDLWFGNNLDPRVELIKKDLFLYQVTLVTIIRYT
jgi:nucleoside-diphosphate-sugar epimerase